MECRYESLDCTAHSGTSVSLEQALHTFPTKHPEKMKLSKALQVVCWLVRICKSKGLLPLEVNDVGTPTVFNTSDMFEMFIHVLLCNFLRETQLA